MLRKDLRIKLCDILLQIGEDEQNLEILRQILCEQLSFEPYASFKRIDFQRNGFVTKVDIYNFLADNGFWQEEKSCDYYIKHYDLNKNGRLSYQEFLKSVLPQDNKNLRTLITQRPTYEVKINQKLEYDVEYGLSRIISKEIESYKNSDYKKLDLLEKSLDFSLKEAFFQIDRKHQGYIDFSNLKMFFQKSGIELFDENVMAIVRRLDKDEDGRVTYDEFQECLIPMDPVIRGNLDTRASDREFNALHYKQQIADQQFQQLQQQTSQKNLQSPSQQKLLSRVQSANLTNKKSKAALITQQKKQQQQQDGTWSFNQRNLIEQGELARTLKQFINLDIEIELLKEQLALRSDFNVLDSFRLFDKNERGAVHIGELLQSLNEFGLFPDKHDLYLFVRRFDKDQTGKLKFSDYAEAIIPKKEEIANVINSRIPLFAHDNYSISEVFSRDTQKLFINLLRVHIENESACEALRQRLNHRKHFDLHVVFETLDFNEDGFLNEDEIRLGFENSGIDVTIKEIQVIFNRFDKNIDGRISFSEFLQELIPTSPKKYQL